MTGIIAIVNVIAWAGFWAFGYLAITAEGLTSGQLTVAALLAFAGFAVGMAAYQRLCRAAEARGYAKKTNQLDAAARDRAHRQGGI